MKTIVITGCSSGFGKQAAKVFADRGDHVFATMRNVDGKNRSAAEELRKHGSESKGEITVVDLDVTSDASADAAGKVILEAVGAPDVLINNAGQMYIGLTEAYTPAEFTRQLDVNVVGIHRVCRALLPAMRKKGKGLIINLSSIAGRFAGPFFAVYNASKWAVEAYSLGTRRELASSGIEVVVVEPGPFSTELFPQSPSPEDKDGRANTYPKIIHETFEEMNKNFEKMFEDEDTPTDPSLVVDTFVQLVDMKPGERPFRNVVGIDMGVEDRNKSDAEHEEKFLELMGFTEVAKLKRD